LGFNIPEFLERDRSTEDKIRLSADDAGVPFISVLDGFQAARNDDLFISAAARSGMDLRRRISMARSWGPADRPFVSDENGRTKSA
jgi:hypothetical protein